MLLNLAGVAVGYALFYGTARLYGRVTAGNELAARILPHVHGVLSSVRGPADEAARHEGQGGRQGDRSQTRFR